MAKHKFFKRLSTLLKVKNGSPKKSFSLARTRGLPRKIGTFKYNSLKRQYFYDFEKDTSFISSSLRYRSLLEPFKTNTSARHYEASLCLIDSETRANNGQSLRPQTSLTLPTEFTKKKGGVHSYLLMVISRFPRKYVYNYVALGRDTLRRYYTMPLRLSMSRFVSHLCLKGYYEGIYQCGKRKNLPSSQSLAKKIVLSLEQRLDSSLLRLLHYKAASTYKIRRARSSKNGLANDTSSSLSSRSDELSFDPALDKTQDRYKVKNPYSTYTALQIKQLISHGKVSVKLPSQAGSRAVKFGNMKLASRIGIRLALEDVSLAQSGALRQGAFIASDAKLLFEANIDAHVVAKENSGQMQFPLRSLDLKLAGSFTKIFYIVYRNMHLIERLIAGKAGKLAQGKLLLAEFGGSDPKYLQWPLLSLLKISSWSSAKPNILLRHNSKARDTGSSNGRALADRRLQLQRLLRWKRLESTASDIPDLMHRMAYQEPSLMYARSSRCYASIVYGTRRCKWVQLQQRGSNGDLVGSSGAFYRKINFFESELEYFQFVHQYYTLR